MSAAAGSQGPDGHRVAASGLDRLGEQVDVAAPGGQEVPVEGLDAVLPDADVDGLGLGRDVGAQLRAASLGEQLDPQRRARRASSRRPA